MGSKELSNFKHDTVRGYNLCNKSVWEISALLSWSTVSAIAENSTYYGSTYEQQQLSHKAADPANSRSWVYKC